MGESLKTVAIDVGAEGLKAAQAAGLPLDLIALWYQFGYLILPALVPAVLWIVLNRRFIESLDQSRSRGTCAESWGRNAAVRGQLSLWSPFTTEKSMEPFGSDHLDERICEFLVERGRLKETDLVARAPSARGKRTKAI